MRGRQAGSKLLLLLPAFFCAFSSEAAPARSSQTTHHAHPDAPPSLSEKLVKAERALAKARNDQEARSLERRAESLRSQGLSAGVKMLLADSDRALGKHDAQTAYENLSAAITLQPDQPVLRRQRGSLRLAAGDRNGAVEDLGVALQSDPGDPTSWLLLAQAEQDRRNPQAALKAFEKASALDPHLSEAETLRQTFKRALDGQPD